MIITAPRINMLQKFNQDGVCIQMTSKKKYNMYVLYTGSSDKEMLHTIMDACIDPKILHDVFIPQRIIKKHLHGKWQDVVDDIYRGYIFVEATDSNRLFLELKKIPKVSTLFANLLSDQNGLHSDYYEDLNFVALSDTDQKFIRMIGKSSPDEKAENGTGTDDLGNSYNKSHTMGISGIVIDCNEGESYKPGMKIKVVSGPLQGMEGLITKLNLHRREAFIKSPLFGGTEIKIGINILGTLKEWEQSHPSQTQIFSDHDSSDDSSDTEIKKAG